MKVAHLMVGAVPGEYMEALKALSRKCGFPYVRGFVLEAIANEFERRGMLEEFKKLGGEVEYRK